MSDSVHTVIKYPRFCKLDWVIVFKNKVFPLYYYPRLGLVVVGCFIFYFIPKHVAASHILFRNTSSLKAVGPYQGRVCFKLRPHFGPTQSRQNWYTNKDAFRFVFFPLPSTQWPLFWLYKHSCYSLSETQKRNLSTPGHWFPSSFLRHLQVDEQLCRRFGSRLTKNAPWITVGVVPRLCCCDTMESSLLTCAVRKDERWF